jgi:hypothetical protein
LAIGYSQKTKPIAATAGGNSLIFLVRSAVLRYNKSNDKFPRYLRSLKIAERAAGGLFGSRCEKSHAGRDVFV